MSPREFKLIPRLRPLVVFSYLENGTSLHVYCSNFDYVAREDSLKRIYSMYEKENDT